MSAILGDTARESCRAVGLDPDRIPDHLAVIMDGNGRWAQGKGWARFRGHERGVEAVRAVTTESVRLGVGQLTLYAFSSENWHRPQREINVLMGLLERFLVEERPTLMDNGVRLAGIGQLDRLPERPRRLLAETIALTAGNRAMTLTLALSYGGRDELVDACRQLAERVAAGDLEPAAIDEAALRGALYPEAQSDVDMLVRTAGEQRVSNFLPFQAVYAEYVSLDVYWPDFREPHLHAALREYQARDRRFGRVTGCNPQM